MRFILALAVLALAAPVAAQQVRFSAEPIEQCLAQARRLDARKDCVGLGAKACQSKGTGKVYCMTAETQFWSDRMQAALVKLRAKAEIVDSKIDPSKPGGFRLADDLAAMQSAWEDWREKTCAFEAMLRRGTPNTSLAAAWCMMNLTGEQALFLETSARYRTKQEE